MSLDYVVQFGKRVRTYKFSYIENGHICNILVITLHEENSHLGVPLAYEGISTFSLIANVKTLL